MNANPFLQAPPLAAPWLHATLRMTEAWSSFWTAQLARRQVEAMGQFNSLMVRAWADAWMPGRPAATAPASAPAPAAEPSLPAVATRLAAADLAEAVPLPAAPVEEVVPVPAAVAPAVPRRRAEAALVAAAPAKRGKAAAQLRTATPRRKAGAPQRGAAGKSTGKSKGKHPTRH